MQALVDIHVSSFAGLILLDCLILFISSCERGSIRIYTIAQSINSNLPRGPLAGKL